MSILDRNVLNVGDEDFGSFRDISTRSNEEEIAVESVESVGSTVVIGVGGGDEESGGGGFVADVEDFVRSLWRVTRISSVLMQIEATRMLHQCTSNENEEEED